VFHGLSHHHLLHAEAVHDDKSDICRAHEVEVWIPCAVEKTQTLLPDLGNAVGWDRRQAWIELAGGSTLKVLAVM
jgi:hypothetical protein